MSSLKLAYLFFVVLLVACAGGEQAPRVTSDPGSYEIRLEKIPASRSGVDFNNALDDTGNLNPFIWNFIYTGSGVATGDINNDGLADIYFGGNQVPDRLYLNEGNFRFRDISSEVGIQDNSWTTGVTMADINADGLLDIYVCKTSPTLSRNANRNKLFINLGDGKFSEQAAAYGIADEGHSIQATFFDADQDGDLDMYLINQPIDQLARLIHKPEDVANYPVTDRFYFNENGRFVDKTAAMGLEDDRYGLGVSLGDFDDNGWTDIYLCNDYTHADRLLMNYSGVFRDELRTRTGHISYYSMGSDAGDINNDGWEDVYVLDMAFADHYRAKTNMESMQPELFWSLVNEGQHYPYAQNTLQLNRGNGYFIDIAQMGGTAKTDWSWSALFADLNLDGLQDIIVTNGILKDMKNNDFAQWVQTNYQGRVGPANYKDVLEHLPSNPIGNVIYRNIGHFDFEDVSESAGFAEPGFMHGLAYADFDSDGLLDLTGNNMNTEAGIYRNTSTAGNGLVITLIGPEGNSDGLGIPVRVYAGEQCMARTMQTTRGYYSSSVPELWFGLGELTAVDSVIVTWNARAQTVLTDIPVNQTLSIDFKDALKVPRTSRSNKQVILPSADTLPFVHQETDFDDYKTEVLLPYKLSQNGPFLSMGDLNGDTREDLFIGNAAGRAAQVLFQDGNGDFSQSDQSVFDVDAGYEDMESVLFDLDGDGDLDIYVVSGSNEFPEGSPMLEDRLYVNDGQGRFTRKMSALPDRLRINGQSVTSLDADGDGDQDLFVGGRLVAQSYVTAPPSAFLINEQGILRDASSKWLGDSMLLGMVTDGVASDVDGDGDQDLMIVGEWMVPKLLINENGKFGIRSLDAPGAGIWWSVESGDLDNDGDPDFVLGNLGWNNKFGGHKPKLEIYASDFDSNGDHDVVLAKKVGDTELPYRGRECSSEEMPFIASKFPTYDAFAKAKLPDILGAENLEKSVHVKVSTFSSLCLINEGDLSFSVVELPVEVQTGPVKAVQVYDINDDGNPDIIYAGNHFPVEVETARYDGLIHGICLGNGKGGFSALGMFCQKSPLTGDYRDLILVNGSSDFRLILARNNGPLMSYTLPF